MLRSPCDWRALGISRWRRSAAGPCSSSFIGAAASLKSVGTGHRYRCGGLDRSICSSFCWHGLFLLGQWSWLPTSQTTALAAVVRQNSVGPTLKLISHDRGVGLSFRYRFPRCSRLVPEQRECGVRPRTRPRNTPVVMDLATRPGNFTAFSRGCFPAVSMM
jgi:hypothetical protein